MSVPIKIKRRWAGAPGAPSALLSGELAYNGVDDTLYIGAGDDGSGNATAIEVVGGAGVFDNYVDLTTNQSVGGVKTFTSSPIVPTAASNDNSTKAASTAYVDAAVTAGSIPDGNKVDITVTSGGATWTINAGAVTLAKMANLAANSIIGNNTGSAATPIALTATQVRSMLNVADGATANTGTVTSVGLSLPNIFSVTGSPVTSTGTLTATLTTQTTNKVFAAPDGSTGVPTFRALTVNDLPTVTVPKGGTGATTLTGYVKGNGTAAMTASASIPWADLSGVPGSFTPAAHTLDSHSNVTITSKATNDLLQWNGTAWVNKTLSGAGIAALASPAFTGTPTAPTAAANTNTTQLATTAYVMTQITTQLASIDAMVYKGAIDASTNPNYPAANAGDTYRISNAGKIGGASGPNVEVGDMLICHLDGSTAGTHASVGANWDIVQTNIDGWTVTLSALGATNWADNSVAIGTGANTVGQVTFGPNTFPGRSSTGNLVAKSIHNDSFTHLATGLKNMAVQAANAVAITGGTIDNVIIDGGTF